MRFTDNMFVLERVGSSTDHVYNKLNSFPPPQTTQNPSSLLPPFRLSISVNPQSMFPFPQIIYRIVLKEKLK